MKLSDWIARLPVMEQADAASGGSDGSDGGADAAASGSDAAADGAKDAGDAGLSAADAFSKPEDNDGSGDDTSKGSAKADDKSETAGKGQETDTANEGFQLETPEGAEAHSEAIETFNTHMDTWIKDNPKASVKDALNEGIRYQADLHEKAVAAEIEKAQETAEGWIADIKADKEFGGDNFDQNLASAKLAIDTYGDAELKQLLDQTGIGNHPAVFRAFVRASKGLKETDVAKGSATEPNKPSPAQILYG